MKKIISTIIALGLALCLVVTPAWAANTALRSDGTVVISSIDSDWLWTDIFSSATSGMRLVSIRFNPGAADDRCVIKAGSDTGIALFDSGKCVDEYDPRIEYYHGAIRRPVLDFSAGTYSSGSTVTFEFDY